MKKFESKKTFQLIYGDETLELFPCDIRELHDMERDFPEFVDGEPDENGKPTRERKKYDKDSEGYDRAVAIKGRLQTLLSDCVKAGSIEKVIEAVTLDNDTLREFLDGEYEFMGSGGFRLIKTGFKQFCRRAGMRLVS